MCFATTRELGTRINLQDISEDERKCSGDIFVLCVITNILKSWITMSRTFKFFPRRCEKYDIPRLRDALKIPDQYTCCQGTVVGGLEALLIMLRRLAYPNRLSDLTPIFARTEYELSLIFNTV
jgi:hypothetical protein